MVGYSDSWGWWLLLSCCPTPSGLLPHAVSLFFVCLTSSLVCGICFTLFEDQRNLGNSACESSLEVHSAHGLCKVSQKSCIKEACLILFNTMGPQLAVPPLSHPHSSAPNTHTVCLTYVWAHMWARCGSVGKPPPHWRKGLHVPTHSHLGFPSTLDSFLFFFI